MKSLNLKIFVSIVLLVLIFLQIGGAISLLKLRQGYVKHKMRVSLNRGSLKDFRIILLTLEDYKKYKYEEDELCINGEMYDIKYKVFFADKAEFIVKHDKEEGKLIKIIKKLIKTGAKKDKDVINILFNFLHINYIVTVFNISNPEDYILKKFFYYSDNVVSFIPETLTPPPKVNYLT